MDVLDNAPARPRPAVLAWAVALSALVVVVPDVRQGGLDLLEPTGAPRRAVTVTLVLDPGPAVVGRTAGRPWDGRVVLDVGDGTALLQVSAAAQAAAIGPRVGHSWGRVRATVDDVRCSGTYGWRGASGDPFGGGRVDLVCDDGSSVAGLLRTHERPPVEDTTWGVILDLADS
jgi:hypothetical protein